MMWLFFSVQEFYIHGLGSYIFFFKQATSDKKGAMKEMLSPFRLSAVRHTQHSMALFCAVYATHVVSQNILLWIIWEY